ncbi:hypothetical protein BASA61_006630 [Batrachochytrium salamandrivorans]|nr:hypothetical protein BASA61_006630 [Batrachochytrium salamandrivorans]
MINSSTTTMDCLQQQQQQQQQHLIDLDSNSLSTVALFSETTVLTVAPTNSISNSSIIDDNILNNSNDRAVNKTSSLINMSTDPADSGNPSTDLLHLPPQSNPHYSNDSLSDNGVDDPSVDDSSAAVLPVVTIIFNNIAYPLFTTTGSTLGGDGAAISSTRVSPTAEMIPTTFALISDDYTPVSFDLDDYDLPSLVLLESPLYYLIKEIKHSLGLTTPLCDVSLNVPQLRLYAIHQDLPIVTRLTLQRLCEFHEAHHLHSTDGSPKTDLPPLIINIVQHQTSLTSQLAFLAQICSEGGLDSNPIILDSEDEVESTYESSSLPLHSFQTDDTQISTQDGDGIDDLVIVNGIEPSNRSDTVLAFDHQTGLADPDTFPSDPDVVEVDGEYGVDENFVDAGEDQDDYESQAFDNADEAEDLINDFVVNHADDENADDVVDIADDDMDGGAILGNDRTIVFGEGEYDTAADGGYDTIVDGDNNDTNGDDTPDPTFTGDTVSSGEVPEINVFDLATDTVFDNDNEVDSEMAPTDLSQDDTNAVGIDDDDVNAGGSSLGDFADDPFAVYTDSLVVEDVSGTTELLLTNVAETDGTDQGDSNADPITVDLDSGHTLVGNSDTADAIVADSSFLSDLGNTVHNLESVPESDAVNIDQAEWESNGDGLNDSALPAVDLPLEIAMMDDEATLDADLGDPLLSENGEVGDLANNVDYDNADDDADDDDDNAVGIAVIEEFIPEDAPIDTNDVAALGTSSEVCKDRETLPDHSGASDSVGVAEFIHSNAVDTLPTLCNGALDVECDAGDSIDTTTSGKRELEQDHDDASAKRARV